ncbi:MAG: DUF4240 domain-containing protein [Alphaproteobacteria bacterium]|nr:DUF4240 domain-containing protein [Alphaproteobacteria bacterium]
MTEPRFWDLIEAAQILNEDGEEDIRALHEALRALPDAELLGFHQVLRTLLARAYSWALWGAAYLLNGGCSDDGFEYFRTWLIARGREAYARVLADPDALVELASDEVECQELLFAAPWIYQQRHGEYPKLPPVPQPELGPGWDFDDLSEMRRRYPRLSAALLG